MARCTVKGRVKAAPRHQVLFKFIYLEISDNSLINSTNVSGPGTRESRELSTTAAVKVESRLLQDVGDGAREGARWERIVIIIMMIMAIIINNHNHDHCQRCEGSTRREQPLGATGSRDPRRCSMDWHLRLSPSSYLFHHHHHHPRWSLGLPEVPPQPRPNHNRFKENINFSKQ